MVTLSVASNLVLAKAFVDNDDRDSVDIARFLEIVLSVLLLTIILPEFVPNKKFSLKLSI